MKINDETFELIQHIIEAMESTNTKRKFDQEFLLTDYRCEEIRICKNEQHKGCRPYNSKLHNVTFTIEINKNVVELSTSSEISFLVNISNRKFVLYSVDKNYDKSISLEGFKSILQYAYDKLLQDQLTKA